MKNTQRRSKKGFTLVELIVVIAIIGVLAAIIVPTTLHFVNEARVEAAKQEASGIFNALDGSMTLAIANGEEIDKAAIEAMLSASGISKTDHTVTIELSFAADAGETSAGKVTMKLTTSGADDPYEKNYTVNSNPLKLASGENKIIITLTAEAESDDENQG